MRLATRLLLPLLLLGASAAGHSFEQSPTPNCPGSGGRDVCSEEMQRQIRGQLGLKSIEEHAAAGDQVRRAIYGERLAVAFVRRPGSEPTLWVHYSDLRDGPAPPPMSYPVPAQVWSDLLTRSAVFDQPLTGRIGSGDIIVCGDGRIQVVEATDPALRQLRAVMTRKAVEWTCGDTAASLYASELARAALPLVPPCALLFPGLINYEVPRLQFCQQLQGDRFSAAEVFNRMRQLQNHRNSRDPAAIRALFDRESLLDWNGERVSGERAVVALWRSRVISGVSIEIGQIEGLNSERVRLTGELVRSDNGVWQDWERAPLEMVWQLAPHQEFVVESATVGAFARLARSPASAPAPANSRG